MIIQVDLENMCRLFLIWKTKKSKGHKFKTIYQKNRELQCKGRKKEIFIFFIKFLKELIQKL